MNSRELRIKAHDIFLESGLTEKEISYITGLHEATIEKAFYGDNNPHLNTLLGILHGLGCDLVIKKKGGVE